MKKLALLLSMVLVVSISLSAQNRSSKKSQSKSERGKKEKREVQKNVKSSKSTIQVNRGNSGYTKIKSTKSDNNRTKRDYKPVESRSKNVGRERTMSRSDSRSERPDRSRSNVRVESSRSDRVYKQIESPTRGRANMSSDRHDYAKIRSPRSYSKGIHHGHIANTHRIEYGYNHHEIVIFPHRVNYHFWPGHHVMLYSSYVPEYEYPWAIYEAEDQMACIEGVVIDFDWDRRSQQFILHFGRHTPFQSASVIIPAHLSRYLTKRMVRKLKRDYVSVCGIFNDFGNVPTIKVVDLDQIYVNEIPLKDFLMYY